MVRRLSVIAIAGVAAIALVFALSAPASTDAPRLLGRTGPGFKITLTGAGRKVGHLPEGEYTITIRDTSRSHNFVLRRWVGAYTSARTLTSFAFVGTKTVTVILRLGTYTYLCSRHSERGMRGSFHVYGT
jgi:hypothetical protein